MAADGSSNLEIIISAVDEASAAIEEVNASFSSMSEAADAATTATEDALSGATVSTQEFADQFFATWNEAAAAVESYANVTSLSIDQVMADMQEYGISAQQAADEIVAANASISTSAETTAETVNLTKGSFTSIGVVAGIGFAAVSSAIGNAISSAQQWDVESATIAGELKQIGSSIPLSDVQAYAEQVQSVTILTQQQALQSEGIILSYRDLAPQYQNLTMLSADLATKMAQTSGTMADNLPNATKLLANALNDPVAGINQLLRQGGVDLPATTVTMIENMAKVGNTAGAQALLIEALNNQVGGLAQAAAKAPGAGLTQLSNQLTTLGITVGNALLPDLDALAKALLPIIQDIGNWVQAHPKLTEAILASVVAFTALLAVLTVVVLLVAAAMSAFAAFGIAIAAIVALIAGVVIANWTLIKTDTEDVWNGIMDFLKVVWDGIDALVQIFTEGWKDEFSLAWDVINLVTQTDWNALKTFFTETWNWVKDLFSSSLDFITTTWNTAWQGLSNFLGNIWGTIQNTVKTGFDDIITAINGFISALDAIHISIPSIAIPGTKLSTPSLNLGFSIPNIPMLADGGFVTQPTLALIGEAGPEAVLPLSSMGANGTGGMTQIVVNVNGGIFPADQSAIKQIGDILAKSIVQNIRVKNYAL